MHFDTVSSLFKMAAPMRDRLRQRQEPASFAAKDLHLNITTTLQQPKPKTSAERSKAYYHRVKNDRPAEFVEKLQIQRGRSKKNREDFKMKATEDEKELRREKNRLRMKAYRERKKLENTTDECVNRKVKPLTRQQKENLEKKKEKDRDRKRKEREGWSAQKKTAERKKARDRYHSKSLKDASGSTDLTTEPCESGVRTVAARAQAVTRVNKALPKDGAKRQQTISDFFIQHSRTSKSADSQGTQRSMTETLLMSNDGLDSKEQRLFKRLLASKLKHMPAKERNKFIATMKTTTKNIESMAAKTKAPLRRQKIKDVNNVINVQNFFRDNSRVMPVKRCNPVKVLEATLENLYKKYLQAGHRYISFAFFCKYRPKGIKTQSFIKFNQSLCEVCENIDLKIKAFNRGSGEFLIKNRQHLLDILLCPREGHYFKRNCLDGKCSSCGFFTVRNLTKEEHLQEVVEVREWGLSDVRRGDGTVKKKVLLRKEMKMLELLDAFEESLSLFPKHNFFANWQYSQYNWKKKNLKPGELLAVLDFAENYRCSSQDEAQAAHWNYSQATIHPLVFHYKCSCLQDVCESVVIITDDLTHDAAAVHIFTEKAVEHIQKRGQFHRFIQFTDGCSAQYKSKQPFMDLQTGFKSFNLAVERNFFGSRHGKGPADGESAVVKSGATRAVKNRHCIIQNAKDLFAYSDSALSKDGDCVHFKRKFIFIDSDSIERRRNHMKTQNQMLKPLKGTRGIHTIKVKDGKLLFRNLTCFCDACESGASGVQCGMYADTWQEHSMLPSRPNQRKPRKEQRSNDTSLQELSTSTLEYLEDIENAARNETQKEQSSDQLLALSTSALESLELEHINLDSQNFNLTVDSTNGDLMPNINKTQKEQNNEQFHALPTPALDSIEVEHDPDSQNINPTVDDVLPNSNNSNKPQKEQNKEQLQALSTSALENIQHNDPDSQNASLPVDNSIPDSDSNKLKVKPGAWVLASFSGKKKRVFLGFVLDVDGTEAQIKFCRKVGQVFTWPPVEDIGWMPLYSLTAINVPDVDARERMRIPANLLKIFH